MIFTSLQRLTMEEEELMSRLEEVRSKRSPLMELAKKAEDAIMLIISVKAELEALDSEASIDFSKALFESAEFSLPVTNDSEEIVASLQDELIKAKVSVRDKQKALEQMEAKLKMFQTDIHEIDSLSDEVKRLRKENDDYVQLYDGIKLEKERVELQVLGLRQTADKLEVERDRLKLELDKLTDTIDQDEAEEDIYKEYRENSEVDSTSSTAQIVSKENNPCLVESVDLTTIDEFLKFKSEKDMQSRTWQEVQILCKGDKTQLKELAIAANASGKRGKAFLEKLPQLLADYIALTQDESDYAWVPSQLCAEAKVILSAPNLQEEAKAEIPFNVGEIVEAYRVRSKVWVEATIVGVDFYPNGKFQFFRLTENSNGEKFSCFKLDRIRRVAESNVSYPEAEVKVEIPHQVGDKAEVYTIRSQDWELATVTKVEVRPDQTVSCFQVVLGDGLKTNIFAKDRIRHVTGEIVVEATIERIPSLTLDGR